MKPIQLTPPTPEHRRQVLAYREEFVRQGSSMDGTAGLADAESFDQWLETLRRNSSQETVPPHLVPATTLLALTQPEGELVGMIDIRHRLNDHLLRHGGHIGYSVRPSCRRQGYAKEMLSQALELCREMGLERVLVTCNRHNTASARTILANGGVLENEIVDGEAVIQRYWITL